MATFKRFADGLKRIFRAARIDMFYVTDLLEFSGGDRSLLDRLHGYFVSEAHVQVPIVQRAIRAKDFLAIRRAAHKFKSTCQNIGARKLALAFESIELEAKEEFPSPLALTSMMMLATKELDRTEEEWERLAA